MVKLHTYHQKIRHWLVWKQHNKGETFNHLYMLLNWVTQNAFLYNSVKFFLSTTCSTPHTFHQQNKLAHKTRNIFIVKSKNSFDISILFMLEFFSVSFGNMWMSHISKVGQTCQYLIVRRDWKHHRYLILIKEILKLTAVEKRHWWVVNFFIILLFYFFQSP